MNKLYPATVTHVMCRSSSLLTVDYTCVVLNDSDPSIVGSDYINANYISGEVPGSEQRYIATQGCLPKTVDDFWRMIWQEDTRIIMMITLEIEWRRVSPRRTVLHIQYVNSFCFCTNHENIFSNANSVCVVNVVASRWVMFYNTQLTTQSKITFNCGYKLLWF